MSISSITPQPAVAGAYASAQEKRLPEDAAIARVLADSNGTASSSTDPRIATLGSQKSEKTNDQRNNDSSTQPDNKALGDAVEKLKKFVQQSASDVSFSVDEESGMRVVKVVDKETGETLRQMPSKEVVELAKALDKLQGLIIKQTA